ncbi:MAG: hypothetical protein FWH10_02890 [Oscillospiraceae bacterium]|nr:hypothetical protein [Oscillospiraceae bacterium]
MLKIYLDNCCYNRPFDDLSNVNRKGFDYTKWREKLYDDMTLDEILDHAADVTKSYAPPKRVEII